MNIQLNKNTISPDIRKKLSRIPNPRPVMEAIGLALVSMASRAFDEDGLRPSSWTAKKDGSTATLRATGTLWKSIRITKLMSKSVTVGSDRPYAPVHQLGSKKKNIPARPFFPFSPNGKATPKTKRAIEVAAKRDSPHTWGWLV